MDNLTHTLIGVGLAESGISKRWGRGSTLILAVASNLPDIDVFFLLGGPLSFLWRRTMTHSVLGTMLLSLVSALIFKKIFPRFSFKQVFLLTGLGICAHVFADLWNAYGVVLFWPFSWKRVDFSWVFIIDLALWGGLIGALLTATIFKKVRERVWKVTLLFVVVYIGVCAWARRESALMLMPIAQKNPPQSIYFYPEPLGPTRFRGVIKGDEFYQVYRIHPFEKSIQLIETIKIQDSHEIIDHARQSAAGKKLDWFFSTPVWRVDHDGQFAVVYGLGFQPSVLKIPNPFVFKVTKEGDVSKR